MSSGRFGPLIGFLRGISSVWVVPFRCFVLGWMAACELCGCLSVDSTGM